MKLYLKHAMIEKTKYNKQSQNIKCKLMLNKLEIMKRINLIYI